MEKTSKYYTIIKELVKQHKKFPGLETILDDIIEDVYKHSEVIITHINNENVIRSYLEKVISTSIITVPKRMNFHSELHHRVVSTEDILVTEVKDIKVNNTLVDKMINAPETQKNEEILDLEEKFDIAETLNSELSTEEQTVELSEKLQEVEPVDEMEESVIIDAEPVLEEPELSQEAVIEDSGLSLEISEEQVVDEFSAEDEDLPLENDFETEDVVENEDSDILELNSEDSILPEFSDALEEIPNLEEEDALQEFSLDGSESVLEEDEQVLTLDITSDEAEETEIISKEDLSEFKTIDYSVFDFTPEINADDIFAEEIAGDIISLSHKRPELNILKVYDMKYKENLSISEIASQIEMSETDVLEALNEIIAVI